MKEPVLLASKLIYLLAYRAQCLLSYTVYVFVFVLFFFFISAFSRFGVDAKSLRDFTNYLQSVSAERAAPGDICCQSTKHINIVCAP